MLKQGCASEKGVHDMFSRKPQTGLTARREMSRKHAAAKKENKEIVKIVRPINGYLNVNGATMPY